MHDKYDDRWVQSRSGVLTLPSLPKKEIRIYGMFNLGQALNILVTCWHMEPINRSRLVDLDSWIMLYPTRSWYRWRVVAWNPCWDQARRGVLHGGANPGVGKLGSGFSTFLVKGCHVRFTETRTWHVAWYLLQDVNRFDSPHFSNMNITWCRLNIITKYDATSIKVVACWT
jgi:hypothetical protein